MKGRKICKYRGSPRKATDEVHHIILTSGFRERGHLHQNEAEMGPPRSSLHLQHSPGAILRPENVHNCLLGSRYQTMSPIGLNKSTLYGRMAFRFELYDTGGKS